MEELDEEDKEEDDDDEVEEEEKEKGECGLWLKDELLEDEKE